MTPEFRVALIGHTGLVGQNILAKNNGIKFLYNTDNIVDICGREFDLIICCGASGNRRLVNMDPTHDVASLDRLKVNLEQAKGKLVLISTIEVYESTSDVDEEYKINSIYIKTPYARNRFLLEEFCRSRFDCLTIRLPMLIGSGLKKNFVYDLA